MLQFAFGQYATECADPSGALGDGRDAHSGCAVEVMAKWYRSITVFTANADPVSIWQYVQWQQCVISGVACSVYVIVPHVQEPVRGGVVVVVVITNRRND